MSRASWLRIRLVVKLGSLSASSPARRRASLHCCTRLVCGMRCGEKGGMEGAMCIVCVYVLRAARVYMCESRQAQGVTALLHARGTRRGAWG